MKKELSLAPVPYEQKKKLEWKREEISIWKMYW